MKHDIVSIVQHFFITCKLDDQLRGTNMSLIPKKPNLLFMTDIRPISLCNVVYKIISKVLANMLKIVIDFIISESQSAFIPGRLITDNIMIAFKVMHYIKRKKIERNCWMAIKLDMSKAYDQVEWKYLEDVLYQMNSNQRVIQLFMSCMTSVHYKISHAGRNFGSIVLERGLRQGDPLFSYLFLICIEGLTRVLQKFENRKLIHGIKVVGSAHAISHMFFVDDFYIFCKAKFESAHNVMDLLKIFERASGKQINVDKSSVFFSNNTP